MIYLICLIYLSEVCNSLIFLPARPKTVQLPYQYTTRYIGYLMVDFTSASDVTPDTTYLVHVYAFFRRKKNNRDRRRRPQQQPTQRFSAARCVVCCRVVSTSLFYRESLPYNITTLRTTLRSLQQYR